VGIADFQQSPLNIQIMSDIKLLEKIKSYDKDWCYQYQKRLDTLQEDLEKYGWSEEDLKSIFLDDFEFSNITSKEDKREAIDFIKRYEWLGDVSGFPMQWFTARYKGILGGVVIMSPPNAFSKLLGEGTENIEALITRGASASWCPFNLGSKFVMWCIKWMVNNTPYRLFTCYSDPQAKEIGSIYQALNFYYLGQASGTTVKAINPYNKNSLISDRTFRSRSMFKRYAKDLSIEWQPNWNDRSSVLWNNIPDDVEEKLRAYSKEMFNNAEKVYFPNKHKYAFVLGKDKKETKQLRKKFLELNKTYEYPKERGK
jgi:hypothetical protein